MDLEKYTERSKGFAQSAQNLALRSGHQRLGPEHLAKVLLEDKESGLTTTITRMAPGAVLPRHEHVDIEQTYVLEGRLVDEEGEVKAGEYVWRPAGSIHVATAPEGALLLGMFLRPNRFL